MVDKYGKLKQSLGEGLKENEPLASHTTFKIGGPARFYFEAQNNEQIIKAVEAARSLAIPYFILGGGANLLVSDKGFAGLAIKNKSQQIKFLGFSGKVKSQKIGVKTALVEADSGVLLNRLCRFTIEEGLAGLEFFLGLPGTVGGAIFMNAHFQDNFCGDFLFRAKILSARGKIKEVERSYFRFGYDQSTLQKTKEILLSAIFKLETATKEILWQKAQEALKYRQTTQPLSSPSAGSIFKKIKKADALRLGTPNFTQSAGFLIEACGLKGKKVGQVQISLLHANFILNLGGAKASDVVELINLAKQKVKEKFGVSLCEEIIYLGEF